MTATTLRPSLKPELLIRLANNEFTVKEKRREYKKNDKYDDRSKAKIYIEPSRSGYNLQASKMFAASVHREFRTKLHGRNEIQSKIKIDFKAHLLQCICDYRGVVLNSSGPVSYPNKKKRRKCTACRRRRYHISCESIFVTRSYRR